MTAASVYHQQEVRAESPIHMVVVLYEQLMKDLRGALAALQCGQIEQRSHEIDHALIVIGLLQGTLDMQQGGEVARNLDTFYNLLRLSLLVTDPAVAPEVFGKQIANLLVLREAWAQAESKSPVPSLAAPLQSPEATYPHPTDSAPEPQKWKA